MSAPLAVSDLPCSAACPAPVGDVGGDPARPCSGTVNVGDGTTHAADCDATADDLPDDLGPYTEIVDMIERVRSEAQRRPEYGFDRPWPVVAKIMRILSSQSWGPRMQRYFACFYGWGGVPAGEDCGDVNDGFGKYEVKVTFISATNHQANFVQIRPWQPIDGYRMFVVDRDEVIWRFDLTKAQMEDELRRLGAFAHGTNAAASVNRNQLMSVRLVWDATDPHCARWLAKYLSWGPVPGPQTVLVR
jgi:hypothetical protein